MKIRALVQRRSMSDATYAPHRSWSKSQRSYYRGSSAPQAAGRPHSRAVDSRLTSPYLPTQAIRVSAQPSSSLYAKIGAPLCQDASSSWPTRRGL